MDVSTLVLLGKIVLVFENSKEVLLVVVVLDDGENVDAGSTTNRFRIVDGIYLLVGTTGTGTNLVIPLLRLVLVVVVVPLLLVPVGLHLLPPVVLVLLGTINEDTSAAAPAMMGLVCLRNRS